MTDMNQYLEECIPALLSEQDLGTRNLETKIRYEAVVIRHLGFDGLGGQAFSTLCKSRTNPDSTFPFTKQMASAVVVRCRKIYKDYVVKCELLEKAINIIKKFKPCTADLIEQQFLEQGLTERGFKLEGIFNALSLFNLDEDIGYLTHSGNTRYVLNDLYKDLPKDAILLAIKDVSTNGASRIEHLLNDINNVFELRLMLLQLAPDKAKEQIIAEKYLEFPKVKKTKSEVVKGKLPAVDALEAPFMKELLKVFGRKRTGTTYESAKSILMSIIGRGRVKIKGDIPLLKGNYKEGVKSIIISAVQTRDDFVWLDKNKGWFYFSDIPRNRLLKRTQKVFSIVRSANIEHFREGLIRAYHGWGVVPPENIVINLLESTELFNIKDRKCIKLKDDLDSETLKKFDATLNFEKRPSELEIIRCISNSENGYRFEKEMEDILIDFDNKETQNAEKFAFSMNLNFSPVIRREKRGVYTLVGELY